MQNLRSNKYVFRGITCGLLSVAIREFYLYKEFNDPKVQFYTEEEVENVQDRHTHMIFKQAAIDTGLKNVLFLKPRHHLEALSIFGNAGTYSFFNKKFQRQHAIIFDETTFNDYFSEEVYAVGGHEAMHAKHAHIDVAAFSLGVSTYSYFHLFSKINKVKDFLKLPIFLGLFSAGKIYHSLCKQATYKMLEVDADISSSRKLGTVNGSISSLNKNKTDIKPTLKEIALELNHPQIKTRVQYLSRFGNSHKPCVFFKSKTYELVTKEERDKKIVEALNRCPLST